MSTRPLPLALTIGMLSALFPVIALADASAVALPEEGEFLEFFWSVVERMPLDPDIEDAIGDELDNVLHDLTPSVPGTTANATPPVPPHDSLVELAIPLLQMSSAAAQGVIEHSPLDAEQQAHLSNVQKAKHDAAMAAIQNIR